LEHSKIGRSTHREGATGDAVRYATREAAASQVIGTVADRGPGWWDRHEFSLRANARVADKFIVSLPREVVDARERASIINDFVARLTDGRANDVPWIAGIHDRPPDDSANPHAHIVISDRDFASGKRVWGASELKSTERARQAWELAVNAGLERAHSRARVSRRSNADRGLERIPQRKVGPRRGARSRAAIAYNAQIKKTNDEHAALYRELAEIEMAAMPWMKNREARDVAHHSQRSEDINGPRSAPPAAPAPLTPSLVEPEWATTPAAQPPDHAPSLDPPGALPQTPEPGSARQRATATSILREFRDLLAADRRRDPDAQHAYARLETIARREPILAAQPIAENYRPKLLAAARDAARSIGERVALFAQFAVRVAEAMEAHVAQREADRARGERKPPGGHSGGR
jgi:hypothetical protein